MACFSEVSSLPTKLRKHVTLKEHNTFNDSKNIFCYLKYFSWLWWISGAPHKCRQAGKLKFKKN
jgi:hypothetical protein